ncbi:MAG: serine hydroxymethyltransferase [Candidatus Micrarchaeia archaeon]|jgi:glycine hydroxymethyltransferase
MNPFKDSLEKVDPIVYSIIEKERARQTNGLELIPSESFAPLAVLQALGSVLNNKYSEGLPGKRYYGGNQYIDEIESLAIERVKKVFGCEHANVQPYSGSPANIEAYAALMEIGDTAMGMSLMEGGHLTHGYKVSFAGRAWKFVQYGVRREDELIDLDAVRKLARECKPKVIVCGATAYPRQIPFKEFAEIAHEVGAYAMADISHISGLIAGGVHPSPFPFMDVVTTTTHKTFNGPRGALIMCRAGLAHKIDKSVFPGFQGGPHNHVTAGIAVAAGLMLKPEFKKYAAQVVANAKSMAETLAGEGVRLVTGGTDNHLILADLSGLGVSGKEAETALDRALITVNKNLVPFDSRPPFDPSGIRLGTPAITSRGFNESECAEIGRLIAGVVKSHSNESMISSVRDRVLELTRQHPLY